MSPGAAQVAFTAEFVLFLVSAAGAALGALRGELLVSGHRARVALVAGFVLLATSALLHGSLLVGDPGSAGVVLPRAAGLVALAWAVRRTSLGTVPRAALWAGTGLLAVAAAGDVLAETSALDDVLRIAGSLALGGTLLYASRRSIAARVAAGAAATVLAVVLAVSVTLSGVLVDNVRDEVLARTDARGEAEVAALDRRGNETLTTASSVGRLLSDSVPVQQVLLALSSPDPAVQQRAAGDLQRVLAGLGDSGLPFLSQGDLLAFVTASSQTIPGAGALPTGQVAQLPFLDTVAEVIDGGDRVSGNEVLGSSLLVVAAQPVLVGGPDGLERVGAVVVAHPVDDSYLRNASQDGVDLSLAVVGRDGVLASAGRQAPARQLRRIAMEVLGADRRTTAAVAEHFVAAHPVRAGGEPVAVLVASAPSSLADETRDSLFQTLFLVALAGTLVAIVLASVLGGRIGAGLRRLTDAAGEIQAGNLDARVGLDQPDELGVLGQAFERMAVALRTMTDELREAAIDEARLRSRLEAVVAGMGEALITVDDEGRVVEFNAAAERLFGRLASTVRGRPVQRLEVLGPTGEDLVGRIAHPGPGPWSGEAAVSSRRGAVPVVVTAAPLRGPTGDAVGAVALLRDVRQEREVERMKTEFLSNISHEMKTPLTPIKGYARMLSEREVPPERAREFAGEIAIGAAQLERVITQLVNFATMAAGRLEPEPAPTSARELLDEVVQRWEDRLTDGHLLERRVARGTPALLVDRRLLGLSLDELVDNALKYSPGGGRIILQARAGEEGTVEVSVSDRGVGVDPARLGTIFDDFTQADASATRRFGGLGLGLPMVRHIARAHGGDVHLSSAPGRGSTFTLVLPAAA